MLEIKQQLVSEEVINNRSYGRGNPGNYIVVHQTGNTNKGADAQAHANIQSRMNPRQASWHYEVDDKEIIQSFPDDVKCWATGDGRGKGNTEGIQIELCINSDGDYAKTIENGAKLVRFLLDKHNLGIDKVKQHFDFTPKNCPAQLRVGKDGITWNDFLKMVAEDNDDIQHVNNPKPKNEDLYRVRKSWADEQTQLGAFANLDNAKDLAKKNKGYKVYDDNGKNIYDPHKKAEPSRPKPKEDKVENVSSSDKGKRVESIYKGKEGLNFYSKPTWGKKHKVGAFMYGMGWTIVRKLKVDGAYMYEVVNSKNDKYYITAASEYVKVEGQSKPKPKPKPEKEYVNLPASVKTWKTYKLNVQPVSKNSDWSLTPSAFGGLTYEVLGEPYPHVVTINTSRGKRNIYVAPSTSANRYKK